MRSDALFSRGQVDPFSDGCMEAARRLEEAAGISSTWRWANPAQARRAPARSWPARWRRRALATPWRLVLRSARAGIAALYGEWYDLDLDPARIVITAGASGGFFWRFGPVRCG